jgi:hypothetical protein
LDINNHTGRNQLAPGLQQYAFQTGQALLEIIKRFTMPFHLRSMHARDQNEIHRVATPLELFFDLVAVIAIAAVTASFHHAISHGHGMEMLPNFLFVFAAI